MEKTIEFYGFRGNIIFPDQVTLFSMGFEMKNDESRKKLQKLLTSLEEDMMLIFFLTIIIIVVDFFKVVDIPLVKNVSNHGKIIF